MNIKRISSLIISTVLIFTLMLNALSASADERDGVNVKTNDKITYRVCISPQNFVLSAVNLEVSYNTDELMLEKGDDGNRVSMPGLPSGMLNGDADGNGQIIATYADGVKGTDLKDGLVVLEAEFIAQKDCETVISYNMKELYDYDINPVDTSVLYSEILINGEVFKTINNAAITQGNQNSENDITPDVTESSGSSVAIVIIICVSVLVISGIAVAFVLTLKKEKNKKGNKRK